MQKTLTLFAIVLLCLNITAQEPLSKEEKKRLRDELKNYMSDLEGYSAKMADIRNTLDSNDAEIKHLKDDLAYAATLQAELENKVAAYDKKLNECEVLRNGGQLNQDNKPAAATGNEANIISSDEYAAQYKSGAKSPSDSQTSGTTTKQSTNSNQTPTTGEGNATSGNSNGAMGTSLSPNPSGTVYKVQIGLYKEFNINKYFEEPRYIGYESVDGMNRYIIGYFPDEQIAEDFVKDVRKMGVKDAFVSKYIDGQRVYEWSKNPKYAGKKVPETLQEALEMEKKSKKK